MLEKAVLGESNLITLPDKIFFCGVPGSRWSGIAQEIKARPGYNTSDRAEHRKYEHGKFSGHIDAYFGTGMEFEPSLEENNLLAPFSKKAGCKLLMSHEWAYKLDEIRDKYPLDWIQLVYRPDWECFLWWKQAGGFEIKYPNYDWYRNDVEMRYKIAEQNDLILGFAQRNNLSWIQHHKHKDVFITTCSPYC